MIERLQSHGFDFKNDGNKTFEELCVKYPKMIGALKWWRSKYPMTKDGKKSQFNISNNKYLKEFLIQNPPDFKISAKCCNGAKKDTSHEYEKNNEFDMKCVGLRKTEGGIRSARHKNCFEYNSKIKTQQFRPIWWFTDEDKDTYAKKYNIIPSRCYTEYGLKRTGCGGCPFSSKFEDELNIIKDRESMLFKAINNIFGKSYEYTRAYREFKKNYKGKVEQ